MHLLHFVFKDKVKMGRVMKEIQDKFHVYNEVGNDLVLELMK